MRAQHALKQNAYYNYFFFKFTVKEKRIAFESKEKEKEKTPAEGPQSDDSKGNDKEEEFKKVLCENKGMIF